MANLDFSASTNLVDQLNLPTLSSIAMATLDAPSTPSITSTPTPTPWSLPSWERRRHSSNDEGFLMKQYISDNRSKLGAGIIEAMECENRWTKAGIWPIPINSINQLLKLLNQLNSRQVYINSTRRPQLSWSTNKNPGSGVRIDCTQSTFIWRFIASGTNIY